MKVSYLYPDLCLLCSALYLRRKGRTDKEKKENVWPTEEKKNRKEKKQFFGQRKNLVHGGEKERRRKRRKTFGERKYLFRGGEKERRMKGGKYLVFGGEKERKTFGPRRR